MGEWLKVEDNVEWLFRLGMNWMVGRCKLGLGLGLADVGSGLAEYLLKLGCQ